MAKLFTSKTENGGVEPQPAPGQILPNPTHASNYSREPDVNVSMAPIRPAIMATRKV